MQKKYLARFFGFVLCSGALLGASACCNDCVPRDEFDRRMADVAESGEKLEAWAKEVQAWIMVAHPMLLPQVPANSDPLNPPGDPCTDPDGCDWGAEQ